MTHKILSTTLFLLFVFVATTPTANAQSTGAVLVANYDASIELQVGGNELTESTVTTPWVDGGAYNTRSSLIRPDVSPFVSGVFTPGPNNNSDPYLFVDSAATNINPNPNPGQNSFHEFTISASQAFDGLDTLSFNYWAFEGEGDIENDTDFTYSVRAFASTDGFTTNSAVLGPDESINVVRNGTAFETNRNNIASFDLSNVASLQNFQGGEDVTFRLSFFDEGAVTDDFGNRTTVSSSTGEHRLDNVQLFAQQQSISAVPEPSALCLLLGGFGLLGLRRRR